MHVDIKYLADVPELVPGVAKLYYDFGSKFDPNMDLDKVTQKLLSSLNTDHMPLVYVAVYNDQAVGTISLLDNAPLTGYEDQDIWVRYLVISPEYQNQGIGTYILEHACIQARELGHHKLALFTAELDTVDWYISKGWLTFGLDIYRGTHVTLLEYFL